MTGIASGDTIEVALAFSHQAPFGSLHGVLLTPRRLASARPPIISYFQLFQNIVVNSEGEHVVVDLEAAVRDGARLNASCRPLKCWGADADEVAATLSGECFTAASDMRIVGRMLADERIAHVPLTSAGMDLRQMLTDGKISAEAALLHAWFRPPVNPPP